VAKFINGIFGHHLKRCTVIEYRYARHTIFKTQYHFIFIKKYRHPVLKGNVDVELPELTRQIYNAFEIEMLKNIVSKIMLTC